jgi:MerR family redox-sensitive transcriptional activator SoxR
MLSIGEVASRSGFRASAIRYYETIGLLQAPPRRGGKRMFSESVVERLAVIELAKLAGFGLDDIRNLLSSVGASGRPAQSWKNLIPAKTAEIDEQMKRLAEVKGVLSKLDGCSCATLEECGRAFANSRRSIESTVQTYPVPYTRK